MSKKKKVYTSYKEIKQKQENEVIERKQKSKEDKLFLIKNLIAYLLLIVILVLVFLMFNGNMPNAYKIYMPLTGIVMILLTYKDPKLHNRFKNPRYNKILVSVCYGVGILELLFSVYLLFN